MNVPLTSLLQILFATLSAFGAALIYHTQWKSAICAALGGGFAWAMYLCLVYFGIGPFWATFFGAAFIGVYGEILAKLLKQPTTVVFLPAIIPLVPGANLYYMLEAIITGDMVACQENALLLLLYALGIALGLAAVLEFAYITRTLLKKIRDARALKQ